MIPFVKAHANGNDFLILEEAHLNRPPAALANANGNEFLTLEEPAANRRHAALARKLCDRNTSIGADGIEFLERRPDGTFFLRLFNSDGSEAELSGNGTRCVAAWLAHSETLTEVTLGTHGGPRTSRVLASAPPVFTIESSMGIPRVMPRTINLPGIGEIAGALVNVGNPHFVVLVETDDFSVLSLPWEQVGAAIATSPLFPHGTNVEFLKVASPTEIAFRIYERGCGPTASSGTGTCASATAAIALHGAARELTATAPGGSQRVAWPSAQQPMLLTGPAEIICTGEAFL